MLIVLFLAAVVLGVAGVFVYMKFVNPSPPTEAPQPDDAMTPAAFESASNGGKKKKGKGAEKSGLFDEDEDDPEEGKKKKKGKKKKGEDSESLTRSGDVDGFD